METVVVNTTERAPSIEAKEGVMEDFERKLWITLVDECPSHVREHGEVTKILV